MKVVVTGGSGLLGQQVVAELTSYGHDVHSLDRKPNGSGHRPSWVVDLRDAGALYEALSRVEAVIHLAAHIAPDLASDVATFNENVSLTYNVLKAAHDNRLRRVVVASSLAAYGFLYARHPATPSYLPIDEAHPCGPTDPYGLSKLVGEMAADSFATLGMSVCSLRLPGISYDPEFRRIHSLMSDPGYRAPGFWTYVDARDAARACRLALEAMRPGHRIYNVAAPSSNMREDTDDLVRRFYPRVTDTRGTGGNWSGMNCARAAAELGFNATHTWENPG